MPGGGGATFTANGETWEFPSVLCAFGEDQIGQPGGVFNLSAIADGLQLYVSIDDSGAAHSLSLNDIEDFENPSVSLRSTRSSRDRSVHRRSSSPSTGHRSVPTW